MKGEAKEQGEGLEEMMKRVKKEERWVLKKIGKLLTTKDMPW